MVTLVCEFEVTEAFKHLQVSLLRVVAPQRLIHLEDVIRPDEFVIHRDEVVDRNINEAKVSQVVSGFFTPILFQVLLLSKVKSLVLACLPPIIELLDHLEREPKQQNRINELSTLEDHRVSHQLSSKGPRSEECQQVAQGREVPHILVDLHNAID